MGGLFSERERRCGMTVLACVVAMLAVASMALVVIAVQLGRIAKEIEMLRLAIKAKMVTRG